MRNEQPNPDSKRDRLNAEAARLGFSLCGVAPAVEADQFDRFERWLQKEYHGEMEYLARKRSHRRHPRSILPSIQSVVMLAMDYGSEIPHSEFPIPHSGKVARYAQGPDYHHLIWDKLNELATWMECEWPGCQTHAVADTAPLLERDFARRAGLGWIGKNTMLINPKRGSFFFLGAILTDLALTPSEPFAADHCGTCTACLDACPTQAFPAPGELDARKCISYLTIEHRSAIPLELREPMGNWLFGCDVCQDVCPWNRFTKPGPFPADPTLVALDCIRLLSMTDEQFRLWFRGTSFFRTKRNGLLRNAAIVLGNVGDESAIPALERAAKDSDDVIAEAAKWALAKLASTRSGGIPPLRVAAN
jgi:epoxyqueuosine reductase